MKIKKMLSKIRIPNLGSYIEDLKIKPTIVKWYKKLGDTIKKDDLLLEVETDQAVVEVNANAEGVLETIYNEEGDAVMSDVVVGIINPNAEISADDILQYGSDAEIKEELLVSENQESARIGENGEGECEIK